MSSEISNFLVSRVQYDAMIAYHPIWMRDTWPLFNRKWRIAGCYVSGDDDLIADLIRRITYLPVQ